MKKSLLSFFVVLTFMGTGMAQEKGTIRAGAGLVYGSKAGIEKNDAYGIGDKGGIGFNINGEYFFTEKISGAPSFTYFFKSKVEYKNRWASSKISGQYSAINLDGRYYFGEGNIAFYGLAGLSIGITNGDIEGDYHYPVDLSSNKLGINLGAGLVYPISDKLNLNAQVKYTTPIEHFEVQAGVSFPVNIR